MNTSTKYMLILFLVVFTPACKKDKLKGEQLILNGNWNWYRTEETVNFCNGQVWSPNPAYYHSPATTGSIHSITFLEKGFVQLYTNNELVNEFRLVLDNFEADDVFLGYQYKFTIFLDNSSTNTLYGFASPDSLWLKGFPYNEEGCETFKNFYLKGD